MLLVPLCWYVFKKRKRPAIVIPSIKPVSASQKTRRRLTVLEIAVLISLVLLSFALARPRQSHSSKTVRVKGLDIVLAIDLSGSMQTYDKPADMRADDFASAIQAGKIGDRLHNAKNEIRRFIESRPNDRIGLIGFADQAYSFVPPTLDHGLLLSRLQNLKCGEIGEMTGIASPIGLGVQRLKKSSAPRRVLVLFTDGANTAANKLTPEQAAEAAREYNVIIHTVGIGGEDAYGIAETLFGPRLSRLQGGYDAGLLAELAKITGGNTFHAADADGLRRTMQEINKLEKTNLEQPRPVTYHEFAPYLAALAALLLLIGAVADNTWNLKLP